MYTTIKAIIAIRILVTNSGLQYFILKIQKIFNFLQENFKKISFVILFNFTICVYF
jgi:hypothetical protein